MTAKSERWILFAIEPFFLALELLAAPIWPVHHIYADIEEQNVLVTIPDISFLGPECLSGSLLESFFSPYFLSLLRIFFEMCIS
ncbi:hypothetical protein [Paenibacillus brevis]|uniref:hypothetical protein n=1 Tax=Paenibacillus brevis TaxID=2841508 RepID=UPI001C108424|nr:hypothetical protein [Paenibacillus brevis]